MYAKMATKMDVNRIICRYCQSLFPKMKRCTRCKQVYYCSRDCQINDWSKHKDKCFINGSNSKAENQAQQDKAIFTDDSNESVREHNSILQESKTNLSSDVKEKRSQPKFYYYKNESYYDVPVFNSDLPFSNLTVKSGKTKKRLDLNLNWTGDELFKYLSSEVEIPIEKLKIIHKGKVLTRETITDCVSLPKMVIQVIGEKCENAEGIDQSDIALMMKQLGIERNSAVKSLRQKGDLIDAILDAANK